MNCDIYDMTDNPSGLVNARDLPDGSVAVAVIVRPGSIDHFGIYSIDKEERDGYILRASCPNKDDAFLVAGMICGFSAVMRLLDD